MEAASFGSQHSDGFIFISWAQLHLRTLSSYTVVFAGSLKVSFDFPNFSYYKKGEKTLLLRRLKDEPIFFTVAARWRCDMNSALP